MTPLAHLITKDLTRSVADRQPTWVDIGPRMSDIHCFEMSAVTDTICEIARESERGRLGEHLAFLPAPKTWIEQRLPGTTPRQAFLLQEKGNEARVWFAVGEGKRYTLKEVGMLPLVGTGSRAELSEAWMPFWLYGALAMINTPRIIGRKQHMPHRGLERAILKNRGMVGKFPLHAWTEIKLHVSPPKDASGEPSTEAHLTGERALHFCRAHLRVRLGRLEIVKAHWRGDPSLGIKQSRYVLAA